MRIISPEYREAAKAEGMDLRCAFCSTDDFKLLLHGDESSSLICASCALDGIRVVLAERYLELHALEHVAVVLDKPLPEPAATAPRNGNHDAHLNPSADYRRWVESEDDLLNEGAEEGTDLWTLAKLLDRPPTSVYCRLGRLGLIAEWREAGGEGTLYEARRRVGYKLTPSERGRQ